MRFLCLHGRGTSADIFEKQLAPLVSRLPSYHQFDFIDGPFESEPAPGIDKFFRPPYFAWHQSRTPSEVAIIHDWIRGIIAEDGPYDGVIGFSEGAALAASLLLSDAADNDIGAIKPLFRLAVFFNAVNVLCPSSELGHEMSECDFQRTIGMFSHGERETEVQMPVDGVRHFTRDVVSERQRIKILTLHVIGLKDDFQGYSRDLVGLCTSGKSKRLDTQVGHELPRGKALQSVVKEIEKLVLVAQLET